MEMLFETKDNNMFFACESHCYTLLLTHFDTFIFLFKILFIFDQLFD